MLDKLEKIREKPEHHRRRIALASTSGVMAVILGIWVMTFSTRFSEFSTSPGDSTSEAAAILNDQSANTDQSGTAPDPSAQSPLQTLQDSYSDFKQTVQATTFGTGAASSSATVSNGVVISDPQSLPDSQSGSPSDPGNTY